MRMLFILLASVSASFAQGWTGWHPEAWTNSRLAVAEYVTMCAVSNGPFIVTNYGGGAAIVSTQWFFSDIEFGQPCSTSPVVNSWSFPLMDSNGVENVETRGWTGIPTTVTMQAQARDCAAIDCYLALKERYAVTTTNANPANAWAQKPRFYRSNRETLVSLKETASSLMPRYADNSFRSGGTFNDAFIGRVVYRWSGTQWTARVSGELPYLSQTNMIIRQGFPGALSAAMATGTVYGWQVGNYTAWRVTNAVYAVTNVSYGFADLTPYRQLLGLGGEMPAVQTYTGIVNWTCYDYADLDCWTTNCDGCSQTITNEFMGLLYTNTVTGEDTITMLNTATNYAPGFDGRDYGWQVLRRAITNMTTLIATHEWIGWDTNGVQTFHGYSGSIVSDCDADPLTDNWITTNSNAHAPAFYSYNYHQVAFPNTDCNFGGGCIWNGAGSVFAGYMRFRTTRANRYTLAAYGDWLPRTVTYYARWSEPSGLQYGGQGEWLPPVGYNTNMHAVTSVSVAANESDATPVAQLPMLSFPSPYPVVGCDVESFPLLGAGLAVGEDDAAPATVDYDFERK